METLEEIDPCCLDFDKGERAYEGMSGGIKLRVTANYDYLFVSRVYRGDSGKRIQITWGFNREGRIGLVEGTLLPKKKDFPLLEVDSMDNLPVDWDSAFLKVYSLPSRINLVNQRFSDYSLLKKIELLLRFGHGDCKNLFKNIKKRSLRNPHTPAKTARLLIDILNDKEAIYMVNLNDKEAIYMVNQAGLLLPSLWTTSDKDVFELNYCLKDGI
jgi:hypothetical protein